MGPDRALGTRPDGRCDLIGACAEAPSLSCPPAQPVRAAITGRGEDGTVSMSAAEREVYAGVDTHGKTHHGAVIDAHGEVLADQEFRACATGYRNLLSWLQGFGVVVKVGVEGTGSYGAGLARALTDAGVTVVEVDRPDRKARRRAGKSDPLDALAAARAARSGEASGIPKTRTGTVEAIRALRVARRGAVKARTAAVNQLRGLIVSAPAALRENLADLRRQALIDRSAGFRVDEDRLDDPTMATKAALRTLARRIQLLDEETKLADRRLRALTTKAAPRTTALFGVGVEVAGQLLVTAGDPAASAERGRFRAPVRRRADPGQLGPRRPPPAEPRR